MDPDSKEITGAAVVAGAVVAAPAPNNPPVAGAAAGAAARSVRLEVTGWFLLQTSSQALVAILNR